MASTPPCCPSDSLPSVGEPPDYEPAGTVVTAGNVPCYVVGSDGPHAIVVAHDVFGVRSGRTRQICDTLAQELGVLVCCPAFFEGGCAGGASTSNAVGSFAESTSWGLSTMTLALKQVWHVPKLIGAIRKAKWEAVAPKFMDSVIPLLEGHGVQRFGVLGFCWGGWFGIRAAGTGKVCCVVGCHPSLEVASIVGESPKQICEEVQCPIMLLPAGNDKANVKEDGLAQQTFSAKPFGDKCVVKTFSAMKHGWVNRGDLSQPDVRREVESALSLAKGFLKEHLLQRDPKSDQS